MDGWTVKLVAAAALTLAGAAGGHALGAARRQRVRQVSDLRQGVERLTVNMLEKLLPLRQALTAAASPALTLVAQRMEGRDPAQAFIAAREALVARDGPLSCLEGEELAALGRLFGQLGASGAAEQRLILREAALNLERVEGRARTKAEEQARLYGTLGLLAGLALAVCLL